MELEGELGEGGPGRSYSCYDLLGLGDLSPVGKTVGVVCWAEAMSTLYAHFAFDNLTSTTWTLP